MSEPQKSHEDNDGPDRERVQDAAFVKPQRPDDRPPEAGASPDLPMSSPD